MRAAFIQCLLVGSSTIDSTDWHQRARITSDDLDAFYKVHDPSKRVYVHEFVHKYETDFLLGKLTEKYGAAPTPTLLGQQDPYKVFDLPRSAAASEIAHAYRHLSSIFHPDKVTNGDAAIVKIAGDNLKAVQKAYGILGDPSRKLQWDEFNPDPDAEPVRSASSSSSSSSSHKTIDEMDDDFWYGQSDRVVMLNQHNYAELVKPGTKWLITFVMTMCGLCSDIRESVEKAARELTGEIRVGAIHCEKDMSLCNRLHVPSVPWMKLLIPAEEHEESYHAGAGEHGWMNDQPAAFVRFAQRAARLQSHIEPLHGLATFQHKVLRSGSVWLVYFGRILKDPRGEDEACPLCMPALSLLRYLSASLRAVARVGKVDCVRAPQVCEQQLGDKLLVEGGLPSFRLYMGSRAMEVEEGYADPGRGWSMCGAVHEIQLSGGAGNDSGKSGTAVEVCQRQCSSLGGSVTCRGIAVDMAGATCRMYEDAQNCSGADSTPEGEGEGGSAQWEWRTRSTFRSASETAGLSQDLLPRAFASEAEMHHALTVMQKVLRLTGARDVPQNAVQTAETRQSETEAPEAPPEPDSGGMGMPEAPPQEYVVHMAELPMGGPPVAQIAAG